MAESEQDITKAEKEESLPSQDENESVELTEDELESVAGAGPGGGDDG